MQTPTEAEMMARVHTYNANNRAAASTQQRAMVSLPPLATSGSFGSAVAQLPGSTLHNTSIRLNPALPGQVGNGMAAPLPSHPLQPSPSTSLPGGPSTSTPLPNGHQATHHPSGSAPPQHHVKLPQGFIMNQGSNGFQNSYGIPGHFLNGVTIRPPAPGSAPAMVMSPAMQQAMVQQLSAAGAAQGHIFSGGLPIQPLVSNGSGLTVDQKSVPSQRQQPQQQPQQLHQQHQQQHQQPHSQPQLQAYPQAQAQTQQHTPAQLQSQPHSHQQQHAAPQHRQPSPMPAFSQPLLQMSQSMSQAILQQQQAQMLQSRQSFSGMSGGHPHLQPMSHAMLQHHQQQHQHHHQPLQHAASASHSTPQARPFSLQQGSTLRTAIDLTGTAGAPHIAVSGVRPAAVQAPAGPSAAAPPSAPGIAAHAGAPASAVQLHPHQPVFDGRVVGVAPTPLGGRTFVSAQSSLPVPPAGMKLLSSKAVARLADGHEVEQKVLEPAIVQLAEAFVESACAFGCSMTRRRKGRRLEPLDMADYLERNWQVRVPGFLAKEVRPYKRLRNTGHQQRKETVQQLQAAAKPPEDAAQHEAPARVELPASTAAPALPAPADSTAD